MIKCSKSFESFLEQFDCQNEIEISIKETFMDPHVVLLDAPVYEFVQTKDLIVDVYNDIHSIIMILIFYFSFFTCLLGLGSVQETCYHIDNQQLCTYINKNFSHVQTPCYVPYCRYSL